MWLWVNCRLFLSIMTFGLVRLSILVEMLVFGYLKNSRFWFGLRLCQLADHSLNVTFPSHSLSSPFFKMELPSTKFRKQVNQHHHYINFNIFFCSDEDLSNALDSDEILNDSIGGLGQQIEKLSSNTLEFCDSIDERTSSKKPCTASHSESES